MIDDIRKIKEDQNLNSPNMMDVDNFLALSLLIKSSNFILLIINLKNQKWKRKTPIT